MKFILLACFLLSFPLYANNADKLYASLNSIQTSPSLFKAAISQAEDRTIFCRHCHGVTGNSKRSYIPNLASQNAKYLLRQFELFSSNQRKDKIMSKLSANLTNEDRINIALYYSSQEVVTNTPSQIGTNNKGEKIFRARCATCHGANGHGKELLPRIAGQPIRYLNHTLNKYQTEPHRRPNSPMQSIAAALSDEDMASVVSFISSMN